MGPVLKLENTPKQPEDAFPEGHTYHISIHHLIMDGHVVAVALGSCILTLFGDML